MAAETSILDHPVSQLLLSGQAKTVAEAEQMYLESQLDTILALVDSPLSEAEFRQHPLVRMLFSQGSRGWEDSLR